MSFSTGNCPSCKVYLEHLPIDEKYLSFSGRLIAPPDISCYNCGEKVGEEVFKTITAYQDLLAAIYGEHGRHISLDYFSTLVVILDELLQTLPESKGKVQTAEILGLRFGLNNPKRLTLREVAKRFGLSIETIRKQEAKGLRQLRHPKRSKRLLYFFQNEEIAKHELIAENTRLRQLLKQRDREIKEARIEIKVTKERVVTLVTRLQETAGKMLEDLQKAD